MQTTALYNCTVETKLLTTKAEFRGKLILVNQLLRLESQNQWFCAIPVVFQWSTENSMPTHNRRQGLLHSPEHL